MATTDFIVGIQTKFQHDVLVKFCKNDIWADRTHGTNHYDFHLITLLVVDAYGVGIPVGWIISNHEDTLVIVEILKSIKSIWKSQSRIFYVR